MSGPITTHVLDTALGRPASEMAIQLELETDGVFTLLGRDVTDADGRARHLLADSHDLQPGSYRLTFDTEAYFDARRQETFFPKAVLHFTVRNSDEHYHVPLLLSPFGYTTYRGS